MLKRTLTTRSSSSNELSLLVVESMGASSIAKVFSSSQLHCLSRRQGKVFVTGMISSALYSLSSLLFSRSDLGNPLPSLSISSSASWALKPKTPFGDPKCSFFFSDDSDRSAEGSN